LAASSPQEVNRLEQRIKNDAARTPARFISDISPLKIKLSMADGTRRLK
jgi:hypothetical protein